MTTQTIRFVLSQLVRAALGLRAMRLPAAFPFPLYSDSATFHAPRAFGALRPALAQNSQNRPGARTPQRFAYANRHAAR